MAMANHTEIADAAERETALDVRRSFIVQAPAGSGKTDLLVKRYVKLLRTVQRPEEILAITFTKKAAAEMRSRVLEKVGRDSPIAHRLRVQTIDALCAALTRQMPVLARFGAQPQIVEDARELYREAAQRLLAHITAPVERLLAHLDNNVAAAVELVAGMLQSRDRWLRRTGAAPTREELEATLAAERERLLARARAIHPRVSQGLAFELLTKEFTWRKNSAVAQSLAGNEPLRQALVSLYTMPPARYSEPQWQALDAILALLNPAVAQLKVIFGERGQADFTEFAHGALLALGSVDEPSELLLSLDRRVSHILVDEFQDTSVSQWELLERLTAGWQAGDGRTLFLVGDPMQSIYRFREAEVALFLHARREGLGTVTLEPLTLRTNFRSEGGIVDWVNASFQRILPAEEDEVLGAVPYSPSNARPEGTRRRAEAVTWHAFYDRKDEAARVVKLLREEQGKAAILVRNRSHLDAIVPALKEAGIRFRAVEIEHLGEKQAVQDLYALTRALSHPGDRIAWLSVLRAPWCGLSLADLLALAEGDKRFLVPDLLRDCERLSPDGRMRAARLTAVLGPVLANRMRGTLRDRVEATWLALGGPACVESETELEDAAIFLDELERLEEAGEVEMQALARSLDELYALPDVAAGPDAVEIMTIHKAKGLEFDTVIVPGLDRSPRSGAKPLLVWKAFGSSLLLAPINATGSDEEPMYNYIRALDRDAEDIEASRLFYVAATRAKSRLHLLACAGCDADGAAKPPPKRSLLAKSWWQAESLFGALEPKFPEAKRKAMPDVLRRLPADFRTPDAPLAAAWKVPSQAGEAQEVEFSWAGETARHVGTVVHRWLQRMAEDELRGWDAARIASLRKRFLGDLARRGVPQAALDASAEAVAKALSNTLADERGRWVLGHQAEARAEYRLRGVSSGLLRTYVMDRVFRDRDGALWIVDYKTSRHEGADVEAFLDRERTRYAGQLRAYAALFEGSRQGLYFPLLRGWREL
jgi:ATP-dependent exoDNAse (exonuclease V) beta subunit